MNLESAQEEVFLSLEKREAAHFIIGEKRSAGHSSVRKLLCQLANLKESWQNQDKKMQCFSATSIIQFGFSLQA